MCCLAHGELSWLFLEPDTGLDHCPRILLSCFRARTSASKMRVSLSLSHFPYSLSPLSLFSFLLHSLFLSVFVFFQSRKCGGNKGKTEDGRRRKSWRKLRHRGRTLQPANEGRTYYPLLLHATFGIIEEEERAFSLPFPNF